MKFKLLTAIFFLLAVTSIQAQTDSKFWFVAPGVSAKHGNAPIYLRMSTLKLPATVTISMPANPKFVPITNTIPVGTTFSQDLTPWLSLIENGKPVADAIENKGIYIESTADINIYYEVLGRQNPTDPKATVLNSDIFALKGSNALGTKFYTPFQDKYNNALDFDGSSAFDIVATEDNTTVTISPTKAIVGHAAGSTFTINLNKGQTYSARAIGNTGPDHLTGSVVSSNKKIAVTVKDDSVFLNGAIDLAGDQLVPANVVGKDYILIKGQLVNNEDLAIIVATVDNDSLYIDGVFKRLMKAGDSYTDTIKNPADFVHTSQPSYVFHLSGFGNEIGGALLPPIKCTGSRQVAVTRDTDESFFLNILVKSGGENAFKLNGTSGIITAAQFTVVPNTPVPGSYMYAAFSLSTATVPAGTNLFVTNDVADFHLAVINGSGNAASCRYGYFSDYGSAVLKLGGNSILCPGEQHVFDIGLSFSNILWNDGSTGTTLTATKAGKYFVEATKGECTARDTALIVAKTRPAITSQPLSVNLCAKLNTFFDVAGTGSDSSFQWQVSKDAGLNFAPVKDSAGISGSKTTRLSFSNLKLGLNGYMYRCLNTGSCPSPEPSKSATLGVYDCDVVIPDVFTPFTKDGKNDFFVVQGNEPNSKMDIYDRWGIRVFHSENYNNDWAAEGLSDGVYFYIYLKPEKPPAYKGFVQVIK